MVSFKRWMMALVLSCLLLPFGAHALGKSDATYSTEERKVLAAWTQDNASAKIKLSETEARAYVDLAYLHGFAWQIDPMVILAMMRIESRFDKNARSKEGAMGLMQVIPRWHREKIAGRDLRKPHVAVEVGVTVLKDCWFKHQGKVIAAMHCYSGGSKGYAQKVAKLRQQMASIVLAQRALMPDEPILAAMDLHAVSNPTASSKEKIHVSEFNVSASR